jgi:hypothetical protein
MRAIEAEINRITLVSTPFDCAWSEVAYLPPVSGRSAYLLTSLLRPPVVHYWAGGADFPHGRGSPAIKRT